MRRGGEREKETETDRQTDRKCEKGRGERERQRRTDRQRGKTDRQTNKEHERGIETEKCSVMFCMYTGSLQQAKEALNIKAEEVGAMQTENIDMQEQIESLAESHK